MLADRITLFLLLIISIELSLSKHKFNCEKVESVNSVNIKQFIADCRNATRLIAGDKSKTIDLHIFPSEKELNSFFANKQFVHACLTLSFSNFVNVRLRGISNINEKECYPTVLINQNDHLQNIQIELNKNKKGRTKVLPHIVVKGNPYLSSDSIDNLRKITYPHDSYIQHPKECYWKNPESLPHFCRSFFADIEEDFSSYDMSNVAVEKVNDGIILFNNTKMKYLPIISNINITNILRQKESIKNLITIVGNKYLCISEEFYVFINRNYMARGDINNNAPIICNTMCIGPYLISATNVWNECKFKKVWNGLDISGWNVTKKEIKKLANITTLYGSLIIRNTNFVNLDFLSSIRIINMSLHEGPAIQIEMNHRLQKGSLEILANIEIISSKDMHFDKLISIHGNGIVMSYENCSRITDRIGNSQLIDIDCASSIIRHKKPSGIETEEIEKEKILWYAMFGVLTIGIFILIILFINFLRKKPIELVLIRKVKRKNSKSKLDELARRILELNPLEWQNILCEIGHFQVDIDFETDSDYVRYSDLMNEKKNLYQTFVHAKNFDLLRVTRRENVSNKIRLGRIDPQFVRERDVLIKMIEYSDIILLGCSSPAYFIRTIPIEKNSTETFELNYQGVIQITMKCILTKELDNGLIWYRYDVVLIKKSEIKIKSKLNVLHWSEWNPMALPKDNYSDLSLSMLQYIEKKKGAVMCHYFSGSGEGFLLLNMLWNMVRMPNLPTPNDWIIDPLILLNAELKRTNCLNEGIFIYVLRVILLWAERSGIINIINEKYAKWLDIYKAMIIYSNDNDEPCLDYTSLSFQSDRLKEFSDNPILNPHPNDYHDKKIYHEEEYDWEDAIGRVDGEDNEPSAYGYLIDEYGIIEGKINEKLQILSTKKEEMGKQIGYVNKDIAYTLDGQIMELKQVVSAIGKREASDRRIRDLHDHVTPQRRTNKPRREGTKVIVDYEKNTTETGEKKFAIVRRTPEVSKMDDNIKGHNQISSEKKKDMAVKLGKLMKKPKDNLKSPSSSSTNKSSPRK